MKKFTLLENEIKPKYESKDSLKNEIFALIDETLSVKITNEDSIDKDININGKEELVDKLKSFIDNIKTQERVSTLEHVKSNVYQNFDMRWLNEQINMLKENREMFYDGNKIKIKIVKCDNDNLWYKDLIGSKLTVINDQKSNQYKVIPTKENKDLLGSNYYSVLYINKDDVEIL